MSEVLDLLREILVELRRLNAQPRPATGEADARHVGFVDALARALGDDLDLGFSSAEVLAHADVDFELAESLRACNISDPSGLGALLRTIRRQQPHPHIALIRDGAAWRLNRRETT